MIKNFLLFQIPWQLLMVMIFIQSSIGSIKLPDLDFDLADKILHFIVFGILGILTARGLRVARNKWVGDNYIRFSLFICILYGASDEIHQYFVPGRTCSYGDWIADILGVITMVWIYSRFINATDSKNKKSGEDRSVV